MYCGSDILKILAVGIFCYGYFCLCFGSQGVILYGSETKKLWKNHNGTRDQPAYHGKKSWKISIFRHISLSFFSSISSVLSTHKDSFAVQWVESVALTKSHSNILHTLLCICRRAKMRFWEVLCFNFFVDIFLSCFYIVIIFDPKSSE